MLVRRQSHWSLPIHAVDVQVRVISAFFALVFLFTQINTHITVTQIPSVIMQAIADNRIVGTSGAANVYSITTNGVEKNVLIAVGSNGFVVSPYQIAGFKKLP